MRHSYLISAIVLCCVSPISGHAQKPLANDAMVSRVSFTMHYTVTAAPATKLVKLDVLIPKTVVGRQKILDIRYSLPSTRTFEQDDNSYAQFAIDKPVKTTEIAITVDAEIYRYDLAIASARKSSRQFDKKEDLKKWLAHEEYLEKDAPEVQEAAKRLRGRSEEETVRKTMAFVARTLRKGPFDGTDHGALWALEKKRGDCTEFADLFVALCRANNLPARFCQGYLVHEIPKGDTSKHDWAEVYTVKYGWVPFDPLHVHEGSATVEKMRPIYVYLDKQRQNEALDNHHYYAFKYKGDSAQVRDGFKVNSRKQLVPK